MKKSLHILLAIAMCLLMFCAACGKDTTADNNNTDTPPDIGGDITPPDTTGDDNKDAVSVQPPKGPQSAEYIPDDETLAKNDGILWMYYEFIHNNRKAYHIEEGKDVTFDELMAQSKTVDLSLMEYGLADYSINGVLELVLRDGNRRLPYCVVLFYTNGKLHVDTVACQEMSNNAFGYSRIDENGTYTYYLRTFSPEEGTQTTKMAMIPQNSSSSDGYNYEVYQELYKNGRLMEVKTPSVSSTQFDEYMANYYNSADICWNKLEPVAKGEVSIEEFSGLAPAAVVRSEAYDTRVQADEMVLSNGIRPGMTYEQVIAITGYEGGMSEIDRSYTANGTVLSRIHISADDVTYTFDRNITVSTDFILTGILIRSQTADVDIFRNIKMGDSIESVFAKIPAMDTELKEWKEQYLYGYEKTDPRGYAQLSFFLSTWQSNYQIEFYTPEWETTICFSRYEKTIDEIRIYYKIYE